LFLAALKTRYDAFADRVLSSLSEIERRDVRAFDQWFYGARGWTWIVWIFGATTAVAWVAAQLPWNMTFGEAAILFNVIVFALVWSAASAWFGFRRFRGKLVRVLPFTVAAMFAGALVGGTIIDLVNGRELFAWVQESARLRHVTTAVLVFAFLYTALVALIAHLRNREYAALAAHLEAEARQSELSRQLAESRLRMLQLQIEPHFLFNTLGSAQQLAEKGAPDAARLIADLIRFLRASTPSMREESATLAQEASLIGAYLAIMQTRQGARLAWSVAVPPALAAIGVPPGMLITLVENAVKHGIEASPGGGRIDVRATIDGDGRVAIAVADTGAGLGDAPGQGIGLANIRERLALLYGHRGELQLEENAPRGFVARIVLPRDAATVAAGSAALIEGLPPA
jgi:sensor histidine kinase YesM